MTRYVATINIPGYLPMDDDPPVFETPQAAWSYLADERERGEDETEGEEYSDTHRALVALAMAAPGTPGLIGTVYGDTPGSDSPHDLGLAYSVGNADGDFTGFVVLYSDGVGPGTLHPDAPTTENTVGTLMDARALFTRLALQSGRSDVRTGDGGPFASVYAAADWDGISYGDNLIGIIETGPRGGVRFNRA
jgi:hypothetical protein